MTSHRKALRVVITGASRGIGRATAIALAREGHRVVLGARSELALRSLADEIVARGGAAEPAPVDLLDDAGVARWAEQILASGPVDVLVNNAGSLDQTLFIHQSSAVQQAEMELNYFGALRATRAFLPSLIQAGQGLIVNVSSILGTVGTATTANYCASKAALEAFSRALRSEVAQHGVRVTIFVAPHTQTELGERAEFRGVESASVDFVADELVRAIERAPRRHAAGRHLQMGLRLAAWFPTFMERQLRKMVRHRLALPGPVPTTDLR